MKTLKNGGEGEVVGRRGYAFSLKGIHVCSRPMWISPKNRNSPYSFTSVPGPEDGVVGLVSLEASESDDRDAVSDLCGFAKYMF